MYIITCRTDDALVICSPEGELTVTVVSVQGEKARLGIDAPPHVPVHRGEVFLAIQSAASSDKSPAAPAVARWADSDRRRRTAAEIDEAEAAPRAIELTLSPNQIEWLDRLAEQFGREGGGTTQEDLAAARSQLLLKLLDACMALDDAREADALLSRLDTELRPRSRSPKPRKAR